MKTIYKRILKEHRNNKFIKTVLEDLMDGTEMYPNPKKVNKGKAVVPFITPPNGMHATIKYVLDHFNWILANDEGPFVDYVIEFYGVPKEMVSDLWESYKKLVMDKYFNENLNESDNKETKYHDFIMNDILKNTIMRSTEEMNKTGKWDPSDFYIKLPWAHDYEPFYDISELTTLEKTNFYSIMKTKYGLSDNTIIFNLWYGFLSHIFDLKKQYSDER